LPYWSYITLHAIVVGILDEATVDAELLEAIGGTIGFFQGIQERGELQEPD